MTTSTVIYNGNLRTSSTHVKSGNSLITDAPLDNHGRGEAFSPTDLLATSLATCMLTVMGIHAKKENIYLEGTTATVIKEMKSNPRAIHKIQIKVEFPHSEEIKKNFEKLREIAENCPVALSLHPDLIQKIDFEFRSPN